MNGNIKTRRALPLVVAILASATILHAQLPMAAEKPDATGAAKAVDKIAAAPARDSASNSPRIQLNNGDFFTGELLPTDEGDLIRWQSSVAANAFEFPASKLSVVHFPHRSHAPKSGGDYCVELQGGDLLFGSLSSLSSDALELDSPQFGRLRIEQSQIRRIMRWGNETSIKYFGPEGLEGWTPVGSQKSPWHDEAGQLIAESPGALLLPNCPMPTQANIEISVSWKKKAEFSLMFGVADSQAATLIDQAAKVVRARFNRPSDVEKKTPRAAFELNVWRDSIVLVREQGELADVAKVSKIDSIPGRLDLQLFFDQAKGTVAAYSMDGKLLGEVEAPSNGAAPSGLQLVNKRGDLRLERLVVRGWTGAAPKQLPDDRAYVERTDGTVVYDDAPKLDADAKEIVYKNAAGEEDRIDQADVTRIVFPLAKTLPTFSVRAALFDGVSVNGQLLGVDHKHVRLARPGVDKPLEIALDDLQSIVAVAPAVPPPPPDHSEGRLETRDASSRGKLVDAKTTPGASCLAWQPYGSRVACPLKTDLSARIVYRVPSPPPPKPKPNQQQQAVGFWGVFLGGPNVARAARPVRVYSARGELLWLRAGDRIPCEVQTIDDRGITFKSSVVDATFLPHDVIKAWERFGGSEPRDLDANKRTRLLTLPRMQRDNPPTHLIESTNGDFLRGRLDSLTQDALTMEVRLEPRVLKRDKLVRVIWLSEKDPKEAAAAPQALQVQAVRRDGVRLTFEPQQVAEGVLVGASPLLGACRVAVGEVDQLLLGAAIAEGASELTYHEWRLHPATDPRFVTEGAAGSDAASAPGADSDLVGKPAPEVRLDQLDGGIFRLSDKKGQVVVLDFWATWCGWCMQTMPQMDAVMKEFADDKCLLVAVNLQEDKTAIKEGLDRLGIKPTVALDIDGATAEKFHVSAIPQTVVIGPDGNVAAVFIGSRPDFDEQLRAAVRKALGKPEPAAADAEKKEAPPAS